MKVFFRYLFILGSISIVLILLWASVDKLVRLSAMYNVSNGHIVQAVDLHYQGHLWLAYLHIIPGLLFLALGAYQLIPYFRVRNYPIHRTVGKLFLLLSLVIFSTAIVLAIIYPFGDWLETITTILFGSFLLFCTYKAYTAARSLQFQAHRNWVTRIYFIAIAVSTIRGIVGLFMATGNYTMQEIFGISFLLAFALHFFLVELWIKYLAD